MFNKVKIKTEFTTNNITIFCGYFNIFNLFIKSNIFKKLDYIKILINMLIFGFKNMNQISLLNNDKFVLRLLDLR